MYSDFLMGSIWFAVSLLLVRAAWRFCGELFPHDGALPHTLHTTVMCWMCITGMGTLLGALAILSATPLLVGVAVLALVLSFKKTRSPLVRLFGGRGFVPSPHHSEAPSHRWVESCWLVVWCAVLAFWVGRVIIGGLLELPTDWDTLMYHAPIIDNFVQSHGLYSRDSAVWYNACNNELFGVWMAAPFSGDFLIVLTNLPAGIIFVLATIELGRQLGLSGSLCHLTTLAALANFAVVRQLLDVGNDVPVASFAVTALFYGLRYVRANHHPDLLFASICLGLGAGVKYFALGPAVIVGAGVVFAALILRGPRLATRVFVTGLAGALIGGGFWYVRNALMTGLPFYPAGLMAANNPFLENYPKPWQSTLLGNGRPEILPLLEKAIEDFAGPCHYLAFLVLPVLVLALPAACMVTFYRGRKVEGTFGLVFCFALVGSGLMLGVTPFGAETNPGSLDMLRGGYSPIRFGLCFYNLMLLALAVCLQNLSRLFCWLINWVWANGFRSFQSGWVPRRIGRLLAAVLIHLPQAAFAVITLYQTFSVFGRKFPGDFFTAALVGLSLLNLLLASWVVRLYWLEWLGLRRGLGAVLSIGYCVAAGWSADALGQHWHASFVSRYNQIERTTTFSKLETLTPGEKRICVLAYCYYPFLGDARQFRVYQPKWVPDLPSLLEYLREHDVSIIAAINSDPFENGHYQDRAEWLRQNPRLFSPLHTDPTYSLFRVNQIALEEARNKAAEDGFARIQRDFLQK